MASFTSIMVDGRPLSVLSFADPLHGMVAGSDGQLFYTDNGGATWSALQTPIGRCNFSAIQYVDPMTALVLGSYFDKERDERYSVLCRTRDGGKTWNAVLTNCDRPAAPASANRPWLSGDLPADELVPARLFRERSFDESLSVLFGDKRPGTLHS